MRVFIAVELPEEIKKKVGDYICSINGMFDHVRWVAPNNLHLTVKFLGEIESPQLAGIQECISATASRINPFSLVLNGVGFFPSSRKPRVVWVGADGGADNLLEMFQVLENHLEKAGYDRETRAFSPHLTIGRVKKYETITAPEKLHEFEPARFQVNSLALIKSTLTPQGPIYSKTFESDLELY